MSNVEDLNLGDKAFLLDCDTGDFIGRGGGAGDLEAEAANSFWNFK